MITVKQLLENRDPNLWSVSPDATVFDAITLMDEKSIGALLVMENDTLVGIHSERDYTRKIAIKNRSSRETRVGDIMSHKVISVTPQQTVDECMLLMSKHHIRHLPVIDNGTVAGMVSIMDLLKSILKEKEFIIEQLESYIAG